MSFLFGNRSSKTFKPKKNIPEGSHQHELMKHAAATLGSGRIDRYIDRKIDRKMYRYLDRQIMS